MLLYFKNLSTHNSLQHFVSTRNEGVSEGLFKSLNLSFKVNDLPENVVINRKILADRLGVAYEKLFFPDQCHTNTIKCVEHRSIAADFMETDALVTNCPGIALGVLAADCVPLVFFDPSEKVIAAAHAGWKGTVKLIVPGVIKMMHQQFHSNPADILVGIGPAISQANYEVDAPVIREVSKLFWGVNKFYKPTDSEGHYLLDLQGLNRELLIREGVPGKNIEVMPVCTFENPKLFFSARRDGFNTGRFGSVIALKSD
jgi:polyphenol oxidase